MEVPLYVENFLILASTITGCVSISAFASLIGIPVGITSSAIGLKICAIGAEVLISKVLVDSVISYDEFVLIAAHKGGRNCLVRA